MPSYAKFYVVDDPGGQIKQSDAGSLIAGQQIQIEELDTKSAPKIHCPSGTIVVLLSSSGGPSCVLRCPKSGYVSVGRDYIHSNFDNPDKLIGSGSGQGSMSINDWMSYMFALLSKK